MNANRNRRRGKNCERQIAKRLGGRRMGILGKHDVECGPFSGEVKSRKKCVLTGWMEQSRRNCPEGRTPIVIVHIVGTRYDDDLVCMKMSDWQAWHGLFSEVDK